MKDKNGDLNEIFDKADQEMYKNKGRTRKNLTG